MRWGGKRNMMDGHDQDRDKKRGVAEGRAQEKAKVHCADWLYGVQKGRAEQPGQECVQYLLPLDKAGKYNVVGVIRRLHGDFQCKLSVRGRPAEGRRRSDSFRAAEEAGTRALKVSLQPLDTVKERCRREVLAAGEGEVDALVRALMQTGP